MIVLVASLGFVGYKLLTTRISSLGTPSSSSSRYTLLIFLLVIVGVIISVYLAYVESQPYRRGLRLGWGL